MHVIAVMWLIVVNIRSWSCVHVHFWCFDFHKAA